MWRVGRRSAQLGANADAPSSSSWSAKRWTPSPASFWEKINRQIFLSISVTSKQFLLLIKTVFTQQYKQQLQIITTIQLKQHVSALLGHHQTYKTVELVKVHSVVFLTTEFTLTNSTKQHVSALLCHHQVYKTVELVKVHSVVFFNHRMYLD